MATSAVPMLMDAIVAGASTLMPNVAVSDGPATQYNAALVLMVGYGDPNDIGVSATSDTEWATLGTRRARDETGELYCVIGASAPPGAYKECRDDAYSVLDSLITALVDQSIKLPSSVHQIGLTRHEWTQGEPESAAGVYGEIRLTLRFTARITL